MARKKNGVVIPMPPGVSIIDVPPPARSTAQSATVLALEGVTVATATHYRESIALNLRGHDIWIDHDDIPLVLALLHRALPEAK